MKKLLLLCLVGIGCGLLSVSCGSSWDFSGSNVTVTVCETDTVVSRGTILILPDSAKE